LIRLDIVEILRDNGFDVVGEAGDGETAVQLATELRPDLVIMDVKMPQLDGISAAEKLSKNHIAPVVLLTAFSQKELVERASEAGALAYVKQAGLVPHSLNMMGGAGLKPWTGEAWSKEYARSGVGKTSRASESNAEDGGDRG
jgi:AmiR/NasT family two-component response regulator